MSKVSDSTLPKAITPKDVDFLHTGVFHQDDSVVVARGCVENLSSTRQPNR